ncbi:torsin-3A [Eublepharis macularius]|uniref:Torsin-3A n=1 Tax=Eublepharis macularius TaxID=481883 RepID=A0AA97L2Q7_EUBMA|nr:torsin-3A [Eublepharis macularius]
MVCWRRAAVVWLCCCLCLLWLGAQAAAGQARPWERGGGAAGSALLGNRRFEGLQKHLGTVSALSRRYWRLLACRLWQEECDGSEEEEEEGDEEEGVVAIEEEEGKGKTDLGKQGWHMPMVSEILSSWYCSFGKCCVTGDCRVTNNITGLEQDLNRRLHGQHLAKDVVLKAVQGFLETPQPEKALALSFHGWSGTGKNFVARIIAEHLYQDGLKSECVKVFISLFHFPHPKYVDLYKAQLAKQISETVQLCHQSLFIFDEVEKLHDGLLDAIKPYMDHYDSVDTVDYRRSIFLFLSNTGGNIINEVALDFWRSGHAREEITLEYLERYLRTELLDSTDEGSAHNSLLEENLIDFLVPFLPLEFRHVKLCARDAFLARGLQVTEEALDEVAGMMVFVPKEEKLFSAQGCKSVSQRINYFLP